MTPSRPTPRSPRLWARPTGLFAWTLLTLAAPLIQTGCEFFEIFIEDAIFDTTTVTERQTPTRWVGHRTITPDLPPLTIPWQRGGQTLGQTALPAITEPFVLKSDYPAADLVLIQALQRLTWNQQITAPSVPGSAHGQRDLHWPTQLPPSPDPP